MAFTLNLPTPSLSRRFLNPCFNNKPTISCSFSSQSLKCKREYTSVMIVPTGIGAAIGGFAGDALPVARALSSVVDCLITHPNVLNAAMLYWPMPNALYVEGYALDRFAEGSWALQPVHQNRVGLVLDAGIEEELRIRQLQVADAARASLGLPVVEYTVTDTPLEVEKWIDPETGKSTGRIKHPDSLLRAVQTLVNRSKVNAIAVVGRFPDDDTDDVDEYRQGMGIDLLAGVEAIISHLVVKEFRIPCAHAPAMSPLPLSLSLSPKSAAEEAEKRKGTFCMLAALPPPKPPDNGNRTVAVATREEEEKAGNSEETTSEKGHATTMELDVSSSPVKTPPLQETPDANQTEEENGSSATAPSKAVLRAEAEVTLTVKSQMAVSTHTRCTTSDREKGRS